MAPPAAGPFDPRTILAVLQAERVQHIIIGALARVLRGTDETTRGLDICPNLQPANLSRLQRAVEQLAATGSDDWAEATQEALRTRSLVKVPTLSGELKLVPIPAGVLRGYEALRSAATSEHIGRGLRVEVAGTIDLIAMSSALGRDEELQRLPALRRILQLESFPASRSGSAANREDYRARTRIAERSRSTGGLER